MLYTRVYLAGHPHIGGSTGKSPQSRLPILSDDESENEGIAPIPQSRLPILPDDESENEGVDPIQ